MELTKSQEDKLRHMLGAVPGRYPKRSWGFRNHYACGRENDGDLEELCSMVDAGLLAMNNEFQCKFPNPKYVLHPGYVFSINDGQRHFITARKLTELYRVQPYLCITAPDTSEPRHRSWQPPPGAIHLYPRSNGNYSLPS